MGNMLSMRGSQRDRKDHGGNKSSQLDTNKMSVADLELHTTCEQIGQKAAMKYRTVREALRYVDADRDGWVTRSEIHYFFRSYDITSETAPDHLSDVLDPRGLGEIEYKAFVNYMGPYIRGEIPTALIASCDSEASTRESTPE